MKLRKRQYEGLVFICIGLTGIILNLFGIGIEVAHIDWSGGAHGVVVTDNLTDFRLGD